MYASLDIGGTFIKYALMNVDGQIIEQDKITTITDNKEKLYRSIQTIILHFDCEILGLAISCPGIIDAKKGYIELVSLLPCLNKTYIKKELEEILGIPVAIENDAFCAAYGELWKGSLQNIETGLLMVLGSGVGGAILIDGKLHTGKHHRAGEIGGLLFDLDISKMTAVSSGRKNSAVWLLRDIAKAKGLSHEDGHIIFKLIKKKDRIAYPMFKEYCYRIAQMIYNFDYILDLERVVIGGGISEQPILITTIEECFLTLRKQFEPDDSHHLTICSCQFKNSANLIGALYHFLH